MISLPKFKELLGKEGKNLTNEEVEQIRDAQYKFARLAFQEWIVKKRLIKDTTQKSNCIV